MNYLRTLLAAMLFCVTPAAAQTIKSLGYNTTNGQVVYSGTNRLIFTNSVTLASQSGSVLSIGSSSVEIRRDPGSGSLAVTANNNTNTFLFTTDGTLQLSGPVSFGQTTNASIYAATTRTNLGLGANNIVTFAGLTNNGNITINQTATNNGLLFVNRTNSESFLGLANLLASNNTTIGNETLFRVGVAEITNKSAQFGFRVTNTNGTGVAVFSLWGNNALCMIGADGSGNAVISSGNPTNEVMTLIVDGATEFARPIRFSTNAASKPSTNAPANTTNVAAWIEFRIGTNSYRAPLYQ